jgi:hypothetical protein
MTETLQRPAGMFEVRLYGLHASSELTDHFCLPLLSSSLLVMYDLAYLPSCIDGSDAQSLPSSSSPSSPTVVSYVVLGGTGKELISVRVQGAVLHPTPDGSQWARVWLNNEREVGICMERKSKLAENGM